MMHSRTVVQLLDFTPASGLRTMELFLFGLAEKLNRQGWRTVHVFAGEPGEAFRNRLEEIGSPILCEKFPLDLQTAADLARKLRPFQPDVLQTHYVSKFSPTLLVLKQLSGARHLIVTDRSSGTPSPRAQAVRTLVHLRAVCTSAYIDRIVAVSEFVRRRNIEQMCFPALRVQTVYNGVDTTRFVPVRRSPDDSVFTIAFAGQLIPEKGVLTLLRAAHKLAEIAEGDFRLQLAGRGHQADELREFCRQNHLEQVEFLGQIDWTPRLFASADVVVVPSEWEEAFGFVAAEAMSCGTPVITTDAGGLPEVVGDAGWVFHRGDADELTDKLRLLMANPTLCSQLRCVARPRVLDLFSLPRMIAEYAHIIEETGASPAQKVLPLRF